MNCIRERILVGASLSLKEFRLEEYKDLINFGVCSEYFSDCEECENADFDEVIAIVDKEWLLKKIGGDNPIQFLKEEYTSDDSVEWYYDAIREKKLAMVAFV